MDTAQSTAPRHLLAFYVVVYFAKGEPRNVEYGKVFLWKYNIWVIRTRKLPDAKFFINSILRNWPNYMLIR